MSCPDGGLQLSALRLGADALSSLVPGDTGTVIAAFRRALYVRLPRGLIAAVGETMDDGPLHLVCREPGRLAWRDLAPAGSAARVTADALWLGGVRIGLAGASVWHPPSPPQPVRPARIRAGLAALRAACARSAARSGFAADPCVAHAAEPARRALADWLCDAQAASPARAVSSLLGLGPGLTPSGDDYLAGVALALRRLGAMDRLALLAAEIGALAPHRTNEISAAHLEAALRGGLRGDLHAAIDAVCDNLPEALAGILRGLEEEPHHSPWDTLAGFADAADAPAARGRLSGHSRASLMARA